MERNRNSKRQVFMPLLICFLILMGATSMQGFENLRVPLMLTLFFAGMPAGVALAHFFELRRQKADEASTPASTPK